MSRPVVSVWRASHHAIRSPPDPSPSSCGRSPPPGEMGMPLGAQRDDPPASRCWAYRPNVWKGRPSGQATGYIRAARAISSHLGVDLLARRGANGHAIDLPPDLTKPVNALG